MSHKDCADFRLPVVALKHDPVQAMGDTFEDARVPFAQMLFQARSPAEAAELSIVVQHLQEVFGRGALSIGCASSGPIAAERTVTSRSCF
ncbi:hypothetical protein CUJ84_pRLN3000329 (plasmid) [Rhizobium leguminosarum]|uniref:Uncharacterized protein n=1 Tax=Rhizobium leguminosarum TaxID=384 RepID=A0A2K9ZGU0_RHILE|nr:hypothetical protein CUJ84_pRLN3000329 [Rhizobium leguminosarum]